MDKFPSRTRRMDSVFNVKESFALSQEKAKNGAWIAGRIVGVLEDGFVLQDESDRIDVVDERKVRVGDIIECFVVGKNVVGSDGLEFMIFVLKESLVLVPCNDDFFIQKNDSNYRRAVIERWLMENVVARAGILDAIRQFFKDKQFLEVDTPLLVRLPGMEPYLDVFKTEFVNISGEKDDMFLITSPEYALKKMLVSGFEKIFQIAKSCRNKETNSALHNPEFTLLEWYMAYASYEDIMKDTENLIEFVARKVVGGKVVKYGKNSVDVSAPWPRVKVKDLFVKYAGISVEEFEDFDLFFIAVKSKGYNVTKSSSYEDLFFSVFMNEIEPNLGLDKPVIVYEYPVSMAALSKKCAYDERYAERFEVYIAGMEMCNAFTELNDPVEQKKRFEHEKMLRQKMGKMLYPVDQSFVGALEFGMPPSGGNALGVDRLVMFLTDSSDIRDVIYFPYRDL